jgi:hypothetical protein
MIEGGIYPFEDEDVAELTLRLYRLLQERLHLREHKSADCGKARLC